MDGIIYLLTSPSGKQYIGQTIQKFNLRINGHCDATKLKRKYKITCAIIKYGMDNFKKEIIVTIQCNEKVTLLKQLDKLERYYIKLYNTIERGYNIKPGGNNSGHSQETIEKIRQAHIGRKWSEATREKMKGKERKKHTEATKLKISIAHMGIFPSEETRLKLKEGQRKVDRTNRRTCKGYRWPEERKLKTSLDRKRRKINSKPIIQYDNDLLIKRWDSIRDAATYLNVGEADIARCCRRNKGLSHGFSWKFETLYNNAKNMIK